jgi:Mor transcription activator family
MTTPANEQEIKSVVGDDGLQKLSAAYGGISMAILKSGESLRRISAVIGQEKAEKLCEFFNGSIVYFPKLEKIKKCHRDKEIIAAYSNGVKPIDLAFKYGLTVRHIFNILKKPL